MVPLKERCKQAPRSDICVCCKRPTTQGTFFKLVAATGWLERYDYESWDGHIDVFREASNKGCRRCALVFDMVNSWSKGDLHPDNSFITAYNVPFLVDPDFDMTIANVRISLDGPQCYSATRLQLLSPNRIRQGDAADWKEAAASMADIYENAFFTIAAACSNDSNAGLRPLGSQFEVTRLKNSEFYWSENDPAGLEFSKGHHIKDAWQAVVGSYSALELTYRTDRSPALAALAQRMATLRGDDTYIAGMWKKSLLSDLTWRIMTPISSSRCENSLPTWSWASTQGLVLYSETTLLDNLKVEDIDYSVDGPAHIGLVKSAVLRIRGPHLTLRYIGWAQRPVWLTCDLSFDLDILEECTATMNRDLFSVGSKRPKHPERDTVTIRIGRASDDTVPALVDVEADNIRRPEQDQSMISVLIICKTFYSFEGLVLCKKGGKYQRIGWISIYEPKSPSSLRYVEGKESAWDCFRQRFAILPSTSFEII
ncbi:hypothetical protein OPT61_g6346 [Boeremia exigua]|uniref:Uncharacterized protein n=1 Tax=Boeremia exigua TaxID=749465 RepID=A0ACC2I7A1_9PLEO|nr:hypothetical protein OPT61_g6346 [Boeremia exigua]